MQNSESVKMEATTTMTGAATPIQGKEEGSQGEGEKGIDSSSQTMELKGVNEADSLDPDPLASVGHKRKASAEIDPHCVNSPNPLSSPVIEHHSEMVPPQGGENEKVEDKNTVPQRGILLDLNQGPEEMNTYLYDDVFKEKVKTVENIEVKPEDKKGMVDGELSDFDLNQEGGVVESNNDREKEEKVETMENPDEKPEEDKDIPHEGLSKMDTDQGEETVNVGKETDSVESKVVPYVAEKVEVEREKIEGEISAVVENTEEALPVSENKQDEIDQMEVTCELNKECDPFSDNEEESKTYAEDKNEVEVGEKMEVEPYDVAVEKKNEEVESNVAEKVEVVVHADEKKMKNEEVEIDGVDGVKLCREKDEEGSSITGENEVVETSSPVKVGLLRSPLDFDLDLNELPSMEDD